jgi:cell division transport system permease protein
MRISFLFSEVITGLRRNVTMTIAMILTTAISLMTLGGGLIAIRMADKTQSHFLDRLEVRLYLQEDISGNPQPCELQALCANLLNKLKATNGVQQVEYLNRNDAKKEVREKTFKDEPELAKQITDDAKFPASLRVKLSDPALYPEILVKFQKEPGVQQIRNDKDIVDRLVNLFDGLRNAAFGIAILQALAALLLIANMVQIAAYTRRTEIGIMRLVGATRWYTQLPFLVEAVAAAVVGTVLAIAGLWAARSLVIDEALGDLFASNVFPRITADDIAAISLTLAPVGILFAALTAYVTLRLYVRE